jgi:hypothetical protein
MLSPRPQHGAAFADPWDVTGGVKVNTRMESSDPDIYAVGDAAETTHMLTGARTRIPLAGPANRRGRIAGANAAGGHVSEYSARCYLRRFPLLIDCVLDPKGHPNGPNVTTHANQIHDGPMSLPDLQILNCEGREPRPFVPLFGCPARAVCGIASVWFA